VIVDVHVNRNATVGVIDPFDHGSVPVHVHVHGHVHGSGHGHDHDHGVCCFDGPL